MHHNVMLYREAAICAQQNAWALAAASLSSAYRAAPPLELTDEECVQLRAFSDDLAIVGQRLPCLTPTLQLFTRFYALLS